MPHPLSRNGHHVHWLQSSNYPSLKFTSVFKVILLSSVFYFTGNLANAQIFSGSVSAATGGSGRAAVEPGDATYLNPATLVHVSNRVFHSSYSTDQFSVSLTENAVDSLMPAALSYVTEKFPNSEVKSSDFNVSLAGRLFRNVSLGLGGHIYEVKPPGLTYSQSNMNVGFLWVASPSLGLGLVFYDVGGEKTEIPLQYRLQPKTGFGLNYTYGNFFRYRLDLESGAKNDWNQGKVQTGFESYISEWIILRAGYNQKLQASQGFGTFGLGFAGPVFGLNYAYQEKSEKTDESRHSIDLAVPF